MNPIEQLKKEIADLRNEIGKLQNAAAIPHNTEEAFRSRLRIGEFTPLVVSSKGATTENKTVNEAGAASYAVMDKPDGFVQVTIGSTNYYLPYFS